MIKLRAWIAIVAGTFVAVLVVWVWTYIAHQSTVEGAILCSIATRGVFLNRIYASFALLILCGLLAAANGVVMLRSGRPNLITNVAVIVLFIAAIAVGANGANACTPT